MVIVKDAMISAPVAFSGGIASPLAEEKSTPGDNVQGYVELFDTFVDEHSSHVDHMFDEMSFEVFTKEVEETSSAFSFLADSEVIQSPKVFNNLFHSCCPKTILEVQLETIIKMVDEKASGRECSAVQLLDEYFPRDMSKRRLHAFLNFDGASKGNPGLAGAGAVLQAAGESLVFRLCEGLGIATNNVAEYRDDFLGLKYALEKGLNTYKFKGTQNLSACRLQESGKLKIKTWWNCPRLSKSLKISLCLSVSAM